MALDFPTSPTTGQLYPASVTPGAAQWRWDGTAWQVYVSTSSSTFSQYEYTATAGQTVFSGADANGYTLKYTVGLIEVYVNGFMLNKGDYTATSTTSVTLGTAANAGDLVTIVAYMATTLTNLTSAFAAMQKGYIFGLTLSTAGSSTTFAVAAGVAVDSLGTDFMSAASSMSKTTSAWAAGTGNGSLDTGAIAANTWYHVHQIKNLSSGAVDYLVSLSPTAPTMPAGYTIFRRIGSMKTNGSSQWLGFTQVGDEFIWSAGTTDNSTSRTSATLITLSVPTGIIVTALMNVLTNGSAGYGSVYPADLTSYSGMFVSGTHNATVTQYGDFLQLRTNTSAQVYVQDSSASHTTNIYTYGWIDTRGRLN